MKSTDMREFETTSVDLTGFTREEVLRSIRTCCTMIGRRSMSRTLTKLQLITDDVEHYCVSSKLTFKQRDYVKTVYGQCSQRDGRCSIYVCPGIGRDIKADTLAHELAHWLVGNQHGHNSRWRRIYATCLAVIKLELNLQIDIRYRFDQCVNRYCRPPRSTSYSYARDSSSSQHYARYYFEMVDAAEAATRRWTTHH